MSHDSQDRSIDLNLRSRAPGGRRIVLYLLVLSAAFIAVLSGILYVFFPGPIPPKPARLPVAIAPIPNTSPRFPEEAVWRYKPDVLQAPVIDRQEATFPLGTDTWVPILPATPSPFLLLWLERTGAFALVNWQKMAIVRIFALESTQAPRYTKVCLSPDGKYLGFEDAGVFKVYATGTGELWKTFPVSSAHAREFPVAFTSANRLLACNTLFGLDENQVWQIGMPIPFRDDKDRPWVLSANGRYLAMAQPDEGARIFFYDLTRRTSMGRIDLPFAGSFFRCHGLAFSPDGTRLAADFSANANKHIFFIWELNTRTLVKSFSIPWDTLGFGLKPGLAWTADGGGLLVGGSMLVDHETETVVWKSPRESGFLAWNQFPDSMLVQQNSGIVRLVPLPRKKPPVNGKE